MSRLHIISYHRMYLDSGEALFGWKYAKGLRWGRHLNFYGHWKGVWSSGKWEMLRIQTDPCSIAVTLKWTCLILSSHSYEFGFIPPHNTIHSSNNKNSKLQNVLSFLTRTDNNLQWLSPLLEVWECEKHTGTTRTLIATTDLIVIATVLVLSKISRVHFVYRLVTATAAWVGR